MALDPMDCPDPRACPANPAALELLGSQAITDSQDSPVVRVYPARRVPEASPEPQDHPETPGLLEELDYLVLQVINSFAFCSVFPCIVKINGDL